MGSRGNGLRRATSAGYRPPVTTSPLGDLVSSSSPSLDSGQSGRTFFATTTQSSVKASSKIREEEQDALKQDQVRQDKVWREFVEAEQRATKYWYQNWSFLKDYDPLGKKKEPEPLPEYVSVFSEKIPNTTGHVIGSRMNTDLGQTLASSSLSGGALWAANWSTIAACLVLKVPQGSALLAAGSARGFSLPSLLLEMAGFFICLRYMSYYSYPLPTYIEYPIIIVQDVILLLFVLHYSGKMAHALPYTAMFVAGWYLLSLEKWILDLSMNLSTVISAASKLAQLQCLWKTKDSGQVSATTWGLATYTCAARIFTTLMTTNDVTVLIRFLVMLILNTCVLATVLQYRKTVKTD
ncbi:hypothetical protein JRQ81_010020 [Phrynocephalus forsythii]|uniref:Solute carrier family 66 member 3 n=1 Tax=Phrynocephalus forsythii TaxID=171643 RepID=A0A9Q0Y5U1_9SAUR|nr:hypothetical protein JRQ81_010020 [Phrynocephalus forsythii]